MEALLDWIIGVEESLEHISDSNLRIVITVLAPIVYILVVRIVRRFVEKNVGDVNQRYVTNKRFRIGLGFFTTGVVIVTWVSGSVDVAAYISIMSAGLAVALHAPIANLAGWFFIVVQHPFRLGDRIQIGDLAGDVVDIRLFMFSILEIGGWVEAEQSTGRVVHIPNGEVFRKAVTNYAEGFRYIWVEMPVVITFESDWQRAQELLTSIVEARAPKVVSEMHDQISASAHALQIHYRYLTPIVYLSVVTNGVVLTLRFLSEPRRRRGLEDEIWRAILCGLADEPKIALAYPTQRYFFNADEGKPDLTSSGTRDLPG